MDTTPTTGPSYKTGKYDWRDLRSDVTKAELIRSIIPPLSSSISTYYIDVSNVQPRALADYNWHRENRGLKLNYNFVHAHGDPRFPQDRTILQVACHSTHPRHFLGLTIGGAHCPLVRLHTDHNEVNFYIEWSVAKFPHGQRVVMHSHHAHLRPNRSTGVVICTYIETQEEREEHYRKALLGHPMVAEMLADYYERSSGFGDLYGNQQLVKVQWEKPPAIPDTVYAHWIAAVFDPK